MEIDMNNMEGNVFRGSQIAAEIQDLSRREKTELCTSVVFNVCFWMFIIGSVALLAQCNNLPADLPLLVAGFVSLSLGCIAYALQMGRFGDEQTHSSSVVKQYIDNTVNCKDFMQQMQRRCSGPPRISAQLSMRDGIRSVSLDGDHWSKKQRSIAREIALGSCTGPEFSAKREIAWPDTEDSSPCKIIVKKTFKVRDEMSKIIFKAQAEDFCNTHKFQENRRFLHFDYLLGFSDETDIPPLVETCLLLPDGKSSSFHSRTLLKVMYYTLSDSVYRLLFYCKTKDLGVLDIQKTIKA